MISQATIPLIFRNLFTISFCTALAVPFMGQAAVGGAAIWGILKVLATVILNSLDNNIRFLTWNCFAGNRIEYQR